MQWVSGSRLLVVACLIGLPSSETASAEPVWRHLSPPQIAGSPGFFDLDGDGLAEIVFLGRGSIGLIDDTGSGLDLTQLQPLPGIPRGGLIPVRQPDGRTNVLIGVSSISGLDTIVYEYGHKPLRLVRSIVVEGDWQIHQVADVQANGTLAIIATETGWSFLQRPALLSYLDGSLIWLSPVRTEGRIVAAQLDDQPGLELVAAVNSGLIVLDNQTGGVVWEFPASNVVRLLSGDFLGSDAAPSFVAVSHGFPLLARVFRGQPYSLVRDLQVPSTAISAYDVAGDGADELISTRQEWEGSVQVFRTLDGALIQDIPSPLGNTGVPAVGRTGDDLPLLLAHATGGGPGRPEGMLVRELSSGQVKYWKPQEFGARAIAFGDSGDDGTDRVYFLQFRSGQTASLRLIDFEGNWLAEQPVDLGLGYEPQGIRMAVANVDGVAGDEILAFQTRYGGAQSATLLDGSSFATRWTAPHSIGGVVGQELHDARFADFDGDGLADVVFAVAAFGGLGGRIVVLSGLDGSLIWQSGFHNHQTSTLGLKVAKFGESLPEKVVFTTTYTAYVYDIKSRTVDWVISPFMGNSISHVEVWGMDDDCRLGLLINYQQFEIFRCDNQAHAGSLTVTPGVEFVLPVDGHSNLFVVGGNGELQLIDLSGELIASSGLIAQGWGDLVAGGNSLRQLPDSPGFVEVLVGSGSQALRYRFDVATIFKSGFEFEN